MIKHLRTVRTCEWTLPAKETVEEEEIITTILNEAFHVHKSLGLGLLERVYSTCLAYRLRSRGLLVETEKPIPVIYEDVKLECGYRADLVVQNKIVVETKSADSIAPIHISQILTQLRLMKLRYGLLLNFNTVHMKDGIRRVLNGYEPWGVLYIGES